MNIEYRPFYLLLSTFNCLSRYKVTKKWANKSKVTNEVQKQSSVFRKTDGYVQL